MQRQIFNNSNGDGKAFSYLVKALAVFGLVVILFLGGLGLVRIAPDAFNSIASVVVSITSRFFPAETIDLTVSPRNVESGDMVTVSFENQIEDDGSYAFFYECRDGVHLEYNEDIVFCNTPYNFVNENNSLEFDVISENSGSVLLPIEIRFTRNNEDEVTSVGEDVIGINNEDVSEGNTDNGSGSSGNGGGSFSLNQGQNSESTYQFYGTSTNPTSSDPNGRPDLETRILEIGYVNRDTNTFTATSSVKTSQRAAVRFEVKNVGTKRSDGWTFNAVLPTIPGHIHHSDSQIALAPGERIEFTLGFDSIRDEKEVTFVVNADPTNSIKEWNENNNIAKAVFRVIKDN